MNEIRHIIKFTHVDGIELKVPDVWCGRDVGIFAWLFQDAQHAALSADGSIRPCKACAKKIIKELSKCL